MKKNKKVIIIVLIIVAVIAVVLGIVFSKKSNSKTKSSNIRYTYLAMVLNEEGYSTFEEMQEKEYKNIGFKNTLKNKTLTAKELCIKIDDNKDVLCMDNKNYEDNKNSLINYFGKDNCTIDNDNVTCKTKIYRALLSKEEVKFYDGESYCYFNNEKKSCLLYFSRILTNGINDTEIEKLYNYVNEFIDLNGYNKDNDIKHYFYENNEVLAKNIENKYLYVYAFKNIPKSKFTYVDTVDDVSTYTVSRKDYEDTIYNVFGVKTELIKDINLKFSSYTNGINSNGINITYDSSSDNYIIKTLTDSDYVKELANIYLYKKYITSEKKDDTITITEKFIIPEYNSETKKLTLYNNTKLENGSIVDVKEDFSFSDFNIGEYNDYANTVVYTFKKGKDGNYKFYSSKLEK